MAPPFHLFVPFSSLQKDATISPVPLIKKVARPALGIVISVLFLALALNGRDLNQVANALLLADRRYLIFAALFTFLSYVWRTRRWRNFLAPQKRIPATRLYTLLVIGFALNNVLPGRPGEFVRAYLLGQREGISKMLGLATIVFERVADGLTLVAILTVISFVTELPGWEQLLEYLSIVIFAVALIGLIFLHEREALATRLFAWCVHRFPQNFATSLSRMFSSFILGLHTLRSPRDLLSVAAFSALTWLSEVTHYFLILSAFNLFPEISSRFIASSVMMVVINLGIMIPAAPGGIGPFEGAGVIALGAFGIPPEIAFSATLVAHGIQFVVISLQGLIFTARAGIALTHVPERE